MNFKKILATLLAVVMVLGTVSVSFAEDTAIFEIEEVEEIVELFEVEETEKIVAKIGDKGYSSVADALKAAQDDGMTDVTINLVGNPTKTEAIASEDSFGLIYGTQFDSVTFTQEDVTTPYYIANIYTGSRTNNGTFVFDGVNIVVTDQYMFEGNVKLINNSVVKSVAEANCFHYYSTTTVEPGSKLQGVIDELRGGTLVIDGGRTDGKFNENADMQDAILSISWSGDSITLKNGAFLKVNSANEVGRLNVKANTSLNVYDSKVESYQWIDVTGTLNADYDSFIKTKRITGAGNIVIDAADFDGTDTEVISADMTGFTGTIELTGNNNVVVEKTATGVVVKNPPAAVIDGVNYYDLGAAIKDAAAKATAEAPVTVQLTEGVHEVGTVVLPNLNNVTIKGAEGKKSIIKDTVIKNADKATDNITGITFDGIVFDNSRIYVNGWTKGMNFADWTITNCEFKNLESTTSIGGVVQFNLSSGMLVGPYGPYNDVALDGLTFTNNVIDGAHCNGVCSGINSAAMEGTIVIKNNVFNDIEFNAIQLQNVPEGSDVSIKGNTFTNIGGQILHLDNNLANIEVNNNVFVKTNEANLYISHISTRIEASDNYYGIGESLADAEFDADYESKFSKKSSVKAPIVLAHYKDVALTNRVVVAGTQIGDEYFDTFEDAVEAAEDGSVIEAFEDVYDVNLKIEKDITIDLNGKTFFFGSKADTVSLLSADANSIVIDNGSNVTIYNGTIDFTGAKAGYNVLIGDGTLTLGAGVNVVGDGFSGNAFALTTGNSVLTLDGTKVNLANHAYEDGVYLVKGEPDSGIPTVKIINAEITVNNGQGFMVNVNADIDNSEIKLNNMKQHVLRNVGGTVTDTVLDVKGSESGIKNTGAQALAIDGTSVVTLTGATASDIILNADSTLAIADTAKVEADDVVAEDGAVTGKLVSSADTVYVQYRKTDIDENGKDAKEGLDVFEIVLVGKNEEKINELASADLTFAFNGTPVTGGAMDYFVTPATGVSLTNLAGTHRYMFNYNGADKYQESGLEIVIGTITVEGYGAYTLTTAGATTNAVYATEIRDNIVEGFTPAGNLVTDEDLKADDGMSNIVDTVIAVPTRTLTVVVDFPNAVKDTTVAYQAMKVEITGNIDGKNQTISYALGGNMTTDGKYVVTEDRLVLSESYTVTVTGEGYRTARYTVTMTDDKEINFWNNVKDNETAIEENVDGSKTTKNFLAGDIVKDNNINIYDLSAVVSYFSKEINVNEASDYVKYDLNRDGVIDSKDVAYVLVSWNE